MAKVETRFNLVSKPISRTMPPMEDRLREIGSELHRQLKLSHIKVGDDGRVVTRRMIFTPDNFFSTYFRLGSTSDDHSGSSSVMIASLICDLSRQFYLGSAVFREGRSAGRTPGQLCDELTITPQEQVIYLKHSYPEKMNDPQIINSLNDLNASLSTICDPLGKKPMSRLL